MGLSNADVMKDKSTEVGGRDYLIAKGTEIHSCLPEERKKLLGSKSNTLHFQYLLGLASKQTTRKVSEHQVVSAPTAVGVVLKTDEEIKVPEIDVLLGKDTGIKASDISYRTVKAGETFFLTYYEFMYLIIRDEYAGTCSDGDIENRVYFSVKIPAYLSGKAKLPTPTINLRNGSIKQTMINIDEQDSNGVWHIKDPYVEKFGKLITKKVPKRSKKAQDATPTALTVALALQDILGMNERGEVE